MSDINSVYSIETANKPLVFRIKDDSVQGGTPSDGDLTHRVEVRSLPGMQKEAIVTSNPGGTWRIVCDEGPYLNGTDLAPFPLAFFTTGLQFCLMTQILEKAKAQGITLKSFKLELDNYYTMKGSFIKGDAIGGAKPAEALVEIESDAGPEAIKQLVNDATKSCPGQAVMRDILNNVFSLHVNGQVVQVEGVAQSTNMGDPDPEAANFKTFASDGDDAYLNNIITKTKEAEKKHDVEGGVSSSLKPVQDRTLHVHGTAEWLEGSLKRTDIQLRSPIGSWFQLFSAEPADQEANQAPTGLAYLSAGVGFCYMTQLSRYTHIAKLDVNSIRIVQHTRFSDGRAEPVDTHVYIDANESADTINNLVRMGEQTCFLHAAMRDTYPSEIQVKLNNQPL